MKLGFIRTLGLRASGGDRTALHETLKLADSIGLDLAYLPKIDPQQILLCASSLKLKQLKIGLDATAFGRMAPSELENAVRSVNDDLEDKVCIGIEMCSERSSIKSRVEAQNFETLFSQDPSGGSCVEMRYPMRPWCPEIVGLPKVGSVQEAGLAAAHGYRSLTPSWLSPRDVARHWPAIVSGATSTLRRACPSNWQVARTIVVHDDPATVNRYVYGCKSPIRAYYSRLAKAGLIDQDIDKVLRDVVISGSAERVAQRILALRKRVGDFGTLHFAEHAGSDPAMTRQSLIRLAEDVMPLVAKGTIVTTKELEKI